MSECQRHCWHHSEVRKGPVCCWCGAGEEAFRSGALEQDHGVFHPLRCHTAIATNNSKMYLTPYRPEINR